MNNVALVFDLDGTLIDSEKSILDSLAVALNSNGFEPLVPLRKSIIGPPLYDIVLPLVSGDHEVAIKVTESFVEYYDFSGYKLTRRYSGIEEILKTLHARGVPLFIATNKREKPAKKIIGLFEWEKYFVDVYSMNGRTKKFKTKIEMLQDVIKKYIHSNLKIIYIGDRQEDAHAALYCGIDFYHATWGYGIINQKHKRLSRPEDILKLILG